MLPTFAFIAFNPLEETIAIKSEFKVLYIQVSYTSTERLNLPILQILYYLSLIPAHEKKNAASIILSHFLSGTASFPYNYHTEDVT